ncbi:MAG TPA: arginine--tRNA ligase, partial [Erysipelothrix sp.]|nr:arginine--tRNA ligase [Erysipelothrix sp.]
MNFIEVALISALENALESNFEFSAEPGMVMLEIPQRQEQGDYASNIAMRLTKVLKRNPREIASTLISSLTDHDIIEKVEVAGPGFINFFIKPNVLAEVIKTVLNEDKDYGRLPDNGKKILVEYVSANPTGQLHVGHARGAAWGDSLTRILKYAGYDVLREFYVNDLGNQITMLSHSLYARYEQAYGIEATLPEDGYHGTDIVEIASDVKNQEGDKWLGKEQAEWEPYFKKLGIEFELKRIQKDLETFRVAFDSWISEKSLYDEGRVEKTLNALKASGDTYQSEGALWFAS